MVEVVFKYDNSGDDPDYRLSPTSRAFHERRGGGYEWYEVVPKISFEEIGEVNEKEGILLTSPVSFVEPLYVKFRDYYEELKRRYEEVLRSQSVQEKICELEKSGYRVVVRDLPEKEEIDKQAFRHFVESRTKPVYVYDHGSLFDFFRAKKEQTFPFEKLKGQDNFEEFEEYIVRFYGIGDDMSLIYPEGSENSPVEEWIARGYRDWKNYAKEIEGGRYLFVSKEFIGRVRKDIEKRIESHYRAVVEKIEKGEAIDVIDLNTLGWLKNIGFAEEEIRALRERAIRNGNIAQYERYKKELFGSPLYVAMGSEVFDLPDYFLQAYEQLPEEKRKEEAPFAERAKELISVEHRGMYFLADKNDDAWKVSVPEEKRGLFIGKGGSAIKKLEKRYGKKIIVADGKGRPKISPKR